MPRARYLGQEDPQPAAAAAENGSGGLSVYWLPPLAAVFIAFLLAAFALNVPNESSALINSARLQSSTSDSNSAVFAINSAGAAVSNGISPIFTPQVQHWSRDIVRWASAASLDPNLLAAVMQIESCGDPRALSRAGAAGLFQVMPFHFHLGENPFNPETNAIRGAGYLARSLQAANGDPRLALAGYNGGIGVIAGGEWSWSAETDRYVLYGAPIYEDARSGAASSPTLNEWYQKYGASLCRQASSRLGIPE
jgi:soluble lytic murein transglycosylase-like protein